jgi:hypothetical protein
VEKVEDLEVPEVKEAKEANEARDRSASYRQVSQGLTANCLLRYVIHNFKGTGRKPGYIQKP